jgi:eukaryotic-like serine/threonine-protein kinase
VRALALKDGKELWTYTTQGKVDSSPVLAGPRAFVASAGGEILALDLETGEVRWRFDTGAAITASPAIARGLLVLGTVDGKLYCFGSKRAGGRQP